MRLSCQQKVLLIHREKLCSEECLGAALTHLGAEHGSKPGSIPYHLRSETPNTLSWQVTYSQSISVKEEEGRWLYSHFTGRKNQ